MIVHYRVNAGYLPLNHWTQDLEQGGGRIIGEACHFIDLITFLVGDPPLAVSTSGLPDTQRYREDNVLITLQFPDGSIGTVSYLANGDKAYPKRARGGVFRWQGRGIGRFQNVGDRPRWSTARREIAFAPGQGSCCGMAGILNIDN